MAEWFGAPIMEKLIKTGFQYLGDQARWQTGMKEELERLRENHPKIQAVVHFASSQEQIRDQNPALNKWLWKLRDAVDEADDVLDELEYMKLKNQLTKNKKQRKVRFIMKSINKILVQIAKRALKIDPNLKRLEKVVQKLDKVSAGVATFLHLVQDAKQEHQEQQLELYRARETGSLPKNDQIGRGKEKEFVMKWLRKTSNEYQTTLYNNISLLSIVGHGGMGKTTLMQHVYKDDITKEFDLKMWVCVSNNFDVKRVIANMLESLKNERTHLETLDALQKSLESMVYFKKFLLVLDDIWDDDKELDKNKWENVLAPLASGKLGSKILVTTRMESVASMISKIIDKKNETLKLEGLKDVQCLLLLNRYAFANVENLNIHHNLRSIAEKIVKKLSGSPLAAKVTGGVLNSRLDENHWIRVLNYDIGNHNDILSVLKLSYTFLPKVLQHCLSFCSILPHDYEFDKDDLVRMWIALGFIQPSNIQGETLKDVGERYFDVLVKKSLFDKFQAENRTYYKLHDLLHEMIQFVSAQECMRVISDKESLLINPETIRHLSVKTSNLGVLKKMEKFKNLRSFYLSYNGYENFVDVLTEIFKISRSIRLLYIYAPHMKKISEEIRHLIHLRYLKIDKTCGIRLPISSSNLYHLQFMICDKSFSNSSNAGMYCCDCQALDCEDCLPRDLNNLHNLHYLKLSFPGMYEIGKLNALRELDGFYVQDEAGYRIEELEHMNELRILIINFLENVKDAKDACSAKLCDKRNLINLSLEWSAFGCINDNHQNDLMSNAVLGLHETVLENLQPHSSLKKLEIYSFMGARSAMWMNNIHLISKLEYIKLENCLKWQTLPPFWRLPFLKTLYLNNMLRVQGFDYKFNRNDNVHVFPSLEVLYIEKLEVLEDWFVATAASYECLFPCLTELFLKECPYLRELPSCPPNLRKLEIANIGWKGCTWLQGISKYCSISIRRCPNLISLEGHQEMDSNGKCQLILSELVINDPSLLLMVPLRSITSIQRLEIKENYAMISFPIEADQWFLQVSSSLRYLNFRCLKSLQSLPSSLESLSFLEILCMEDVPQLQLLPNIPASLERLELVYLESLQCLPTSLPFSLKYLELVGIPLQKLPDLPPSLCELRLFNLEHLDCLPSCLHNISSLLELVIYKVPQLEELPDLPPSLKSLSIEYCHPQLMERYGKYAASYEHRIGHIHRVRI